MAVRSPITLLDVPYISDGLHGFYGWNHEQDGFAKFRATEALANDLYDYVNSGLPYDKHHAKYSVAQTKAALNLLRSYLWREKFLGLKPLIVATSSSLEVLEDRLVDEDALSSFRVVTFEQLIQEAETLTIYDRAVRTLENLYWQWEKNPQAPLNFKGYTSVDAHQHFVIRTRPESKEDGSAFGCDEKTAPFVFEFLLEQGWVKVLEGNPMPQGFLLSSKGFAELDKLQRGLGPLQRQVFFVRRYDHELDAFLEPVLSEVSSQINCPILPVWGSEHNDRIDERIFRLIRQSPAILVHVDSKNFNVGLEVGYAIALGKPVVAFREKPVPWIAPPFDIATLNVFDYSVDKPRDLVEKLTARIGLALDTR